MSDILTRAIVKLYESERFYAEVLMGMDRFYTKSIPTAGVCIKDRVQLYVNPEFFGSLPLQTQIAVLKHECQHILFDHIPRSKAIAPEIYEKQERPKDVDGVVDSFINSAKAKALNIAADCAINCNLPDLMEDSMFPKRFDLPDGETMEWYHEHLKDNEQMKQMTGFDDHSLWAESEGDKDILREKIKKHINEAAERTRASGHMTMSDELLVDRLNYSPRDWRSDLRRFIAKSTEVRLESSRKKRNRRYGVTYPGTVKHEELHIGVALDTSGSISDEALSQFMAEVGNIAKYALVTVVEADVEVQNAYTFDPKKQYTVKGRGGTAYQPALDYFTNETEVDGVIYFGDMDNFDNEELKKPKYPVMWAVVGNQAPPADWGYKTKIEVKRV